MNETWLFKIYGNAYLYTRKIPICIYEGQDMYERISNHFWKKSLRGGLVCNHECSVFGMWFTQHGVLKNKKGMNVSRIPAKHSKRANDQTYPCIFVNRTNSSPVLELWQPMSVLCVFDMTTTISGRTIPDTPLGPRELPNQVY